VCRHRQYRVSYLELNFSLSAKGHSESGSKFALLTYSLTTCPSMLRRNKLKRTINRKRSYGSFTGKNSVHVSSWLGFVIYPWINAESISVLVSPIGFERRRRSRDASSRNTYYFTFPAMELTEGSLKPRVPGAGFPILWDSGICRVDIAGGIEGPAGYDTIQVHLAKAMVHTRALHWVPMPTHAHGFWVGMGAILLFMGGHGWAWVGIGFVYPCIQLQIGVKLLIC